jgi:large subunit ribosomal protein L23
MARKKKEVVTAAPKDFETLRSPVITEKSSVVGAEGNTVVFKIDERATKLDVRAAVERVYNVKVKAVRTVNVLGKVKRSARSMGRRASSKKAYVTLQKGQTINIVEGL